MQLGDPTAAPSQRGRLDVVLDKLNANLTELIEAVDCGGLDQLDAAQKLPVWWQRFEAFRNKLPLIDHTLIADAQASDLAGSYGFSSLTRFVTRIVQLSHGEAAARVRAAAAVGPRTSMLREHLEPRLPKLAALQRQGAVSVEKVQIVEPAMHKLTRPGLDPQAVETAEQLLTDYAPLLGPTDLHRYALKVVDAADPDGPEPIDDQLQTRPPLSRTQTAPRRHVVAAGQTQQHRRRPTQRHLGPVEPAAQQQHRRPERKHHRHSRSAALGAAAA